VVHQFRAAIEARDLDAAVALLREDVVFRSPVVFTPYEGREAMRQIQSAM
jgi:ketosteroid isomerase-like protein